MGTKGGGFEWDVARGLSKWLTEGEDDGQLVRSRGSGSWATQRQRKHKSSDAQLGDLAAAGPDVHENVSMFLRLFFVECKAYKDEPNLWALFRCTDAEELCTSELMRWWDKASTQAAAVERVPMLIVRRNYRPILVATPDAVTWSPIRVGVHWADHDFMLEPYAELLKMNPKEVLGFYGG